MKNHVIILAALFCSYIVFSQNKAQDHNSSRSNKTASIIFNNPYDGSEIRVYNQNTSQNKAQDHNSSRSNKTASIIFNNPYEDHDLRAYNQNSSRSNNAKAYSLNSSTTNNIRSFDQSWDIGMNISASMGLNSSESTLFRGNSFATKMYANYNMGIAGIGISSGFLPGSIDDNAVNQFITDRKYKVESIGINQTKPFNSYVLFGPTLKIGNTVKVIGAFQAGLFLNNSGALALNTVEANGVSRTIYRFDSGSKNVFPGFSGNIAVSYPISRSSSFFISSEYLQTKSSVRLYDPQNGIDTPNEQKRDVKLFNFGIGISKTFSFSNKTQFIIPKVSNREVSFDESDVYVDPMILTRDRPSGMATGKRNAQYNPNEILIDASKTIDETGTYLERSVVTRDRPSGMATGKRTAENCGPVTIKEIYPDGTVQEKTFACPEDALVYSKQTQGATFGEKVNSGLVQAGGALASGASLLHNENIVHRDIAARNILVGKITQGISDLGIATNKNTGGGAASAAYAATGFMVQNQGVTSTIYLRESGSGIATGRRQYQLAYSDDSENSGLPTGRRSSVKSNPMYQDNNNQGVNPLYNGKRVSNTGRDEDCDGVEGLSVNLIDLHSGVIMAITKTETCGTFYFANVPSGDYIVKTTGSFVTKKGYDIDLKGKTDVAGKIVATENYWNIDCTTATGTEEDAIALIKTKTKSNQSNDRMGVSEPNTYKTGVNTSRSNIKNMLITFGDSDGDGMTDIVIGGTISNSLNNNNPVTLRPGNPIGGLTIKGGKNPGGNSRTLQTNENGEFEFADLKAGNYTISTEIINYFDDETIITLGTDEMSSNINSNEAGPKGGSKISPSQNSQSLRQSGSSDFDDTQQNDTNTSTNKSQNNNTTRSIRGTKPIK